MSSEQRAALVGRIKERIYQEWEVWEDGEAPGDRTYSSVAAEAALAAVEAAGGWPPMETTELKPFVGRIDDQEATPEPDAEVRDVLAEAIWDAATQSEWLPQGLTERQADAGLAALRAKGFAVVRTADVEAARDCARGMALECRGKPKDDYNALADRLQEAIR